MQIEINGELEKVINAAILSGEFKSPEEYIREAIKSYRIQKLNEALAVGMEQLQRGEGAELDLEELFAELDAEEVTSEYHAQS